MTARKRTVRRVEGADVFTAIAHPVRRQILVHLTGGTMNANDIAEPFEVSRSAVSQHLGILLEAGLVEREKQGRVQVYTLRPEALNDVQDWMNQFAKLWPQKLDALESLLDELSQDDETS